MKRLTKEQREDVAFWRQAAQDYERHCPRSTYLYGDMRGLCSYCVDRAFAIEPSGWAALERHERQLRALKPTGRLWSPKTGPVAFDVRATACCLIAAMIEAGDLK